jgi:ribosomal protein L12E/L44/L45/RPP1/RPP2
MKKIAVILALMFAFSWSVGVAAEKEKQWFVIKDVNGVCSVRQLKAKTEKTIAGPFSTKAAAEKAKEEKCPPVSKKKNEKEKKN